MRSILSRFSAVRMPIAIAGIRARALKSRRVNGRPTTFRQISSDSESRLPPSLCFQHIEISLDSLDLLVRTLQANPEHAKTCRSLTFPSRWVENEQEEEQAFPATESLSSFKDSLVFVLQLLAKHGRLLAVHWNSYMSRDGHNDVVFPKEAWAAIALNHRSLRELDVVVSGLGEEQNAWFPLTLPVYPHLRVLRVNLPDAHGWHCEELQKMLDRHCPVLEDLALQLPMCCGPSGITLLNTHPHLKSFELESTHLCSSAEDRGAGEDFLVRHPQIQRLSLRSDHYLHPAGPQSKLRALRIDQSTILTIRARLFGPTQDDSDLSSFALSAYGTDITHLRLVNVPHLSSPLVPGVVRSLAHTLRCLELDREDFRSFKVLLEHIRELLADATQLEELAIMGANSWPISPYWTVNHLRDLLSVLSKIPALPLRAIRFFSHSNGVQAEPLPAQFLEDMGSMPDRLEYIRWDVFRLREDDVQSTLYRVERVKDGRLESNKACLMHEARLPWSQRRADWTGESILDHLA